MVKSAVINKLRKKEFMFRIIVFSDTHRHVWPAIDQIEKIGSVDMIIHLGDMASDVEDIRSAYPGIRLESVCGNNDFAFGQVYEKVVKAEGHLIFMCHGHTRGVKFETESLLSEAREKNCGAALYGHTHIEVCEKRDGIYLMNPGSVRYSGTYGIIEIEDGRLSACILPLA